MGEAPDTGPQSPLIESSSTEDNMQAGIVEAQAKVESTVDIQVVGDDVPSDMHSSAVEDGEADDDSNEAVGKEEAAELDQDMVDSEPDKTDEAVVTVDPLEPSNVASMFQKILALGGSSSGQIAVKVDDSDRSNDKVTATTAPTTMPITGPSASQPTLVQNGRMVSLNKSQIIELSQLWGEFILTLLCLLRCVTCLTTLFMQVPQQS